MFTNVFHSEQATLYSNASVQVESLPCVSHNVSVQTLNLSSATSKSGIENEYDEHRDGILTPLLVEAEIEYCEILGMPVGGAFRKALIEEKTDMQRMEMSLGIKRIGKEIDKALRDSTPSLPIQTDAFTVLEMGQHHNVTSSPQCAGTRSDEHNEAWPCATCGIEDNNAYDMHCYICGGSRH